MCSSEQPVSSKSAQESGVSEWTDPSFYVVPSTALSSLVHSSSPEPGVFSSLWLTLFLIWIAFNYVTTKSSRTEIAAAAATYPLYDSVISSALRLCLALKS